MFTFCSLLPQ